MNKTLLRIALNAPKNPYIALDRTYFVRTDVNAEWQEVLDRPQQDLFDAGLAKSEQNKLDYAVFNPYQVAEHQVQVFDNGRKVILTFQDLRIAHGVNGTDPLRGTVRKVMDFGGIRHVEAGNNFMKRMFTTHSVPFIIANGLRDSQHATSVLLLDNPKLVPGFLTYLTPVKSLSDLATSIGGKGSASALFRYIFLNKPDYNVQTDVYLKEFLENGVPTGLGALKEMTGYDKEFKQQLRQAERLLREGKHNAFEKMIKQWMLKSPQKAMNMISGLNTLVESNTRLAVYCAARDKGYSELKAGSIAKNISINFNKSGTLKRPLDLVFLFTNPAIQALYQQYTLAKKHPARYTLMLTSLVGLGMAMSLLARLMAGSDEDGNNFYDMISETIRKKNIIFFYGDGRNDYFKIPVAQFLRIFTGIGVDIADIIGGRKNFTDKLLKVPVDVISGISPVDVGLGFHTMRDGDYYVGGIVAASAKPIYESFLAGEDAFGYLVSGQNEYNKYLPEYKRSLKSTAKPFVEISRFLNNIIGGDNATPGLLNFNPDKMEHTLQGYTASTGKFYLDIYKTASYIWNKNYGDKTQELEPRNIPLYNVIAGSVTQKTIDSYFYQNFIELKNEYEKQKSRIKAYRKDGEPEKADKIEKSEEYTTIRFVSETDRLLSSLRKTEKEAMSDEEVNKLKPIKSGILRESMRATNQDSEHYLDAIAKYKELNAKASDYNSKRKKDLVPYNEELENLYSTLNTAWGYRSRNAKIESALKDLWKDENDNPIGEPSKEKQQEIIELINSIDQ
jgi:hypothetical protein